MKTLTVIDTFGFFFRNYYALPNLHNKEGFPTGLLTGFANFIYTIKSELESDYILFALDAKGKNFRHDIDPNYKANRPEAPEDLKKQLPVAIHWIEKMGFKCYSEEGYEADDVIASAVKFAKQNDIRVRIVTHDKDLYQLIDDDQITVYDPTKKIDINEEKCFEKFGVYPKRIQDYLALVGDVADNIPGVKGIGPKGAKKLFDQFATLEEIYENIDKVANPRSQKLLLEGKENAFMSRKLAALHPHLDVSDRFETFYFPEEQPLLGIVDELKRYDLRQMLSRLKMPQEPKKETEKIHFEAILLDTKEKLFSVIDAIESHAIVAFDTETNSLDAQHAHIVGFSFCVQEDKAYYVPIHHNYLGVGAQVAMEDAKEAIKRLFSHKIVGQNLKYDLAIIENNFDFEALPIHADTMIMAWLLNPEKNVGLDTLSKRFFDHDMVKFKDTVKKGETFASVDIESALLYASEDAWMTLKVYNKIQDLLEPELLDLAKELEFPFIQTLLKMEREGIGIDVRYFKALLDNAQITIETLRQNIYHDSGCEFNVNSVQQLGKVLFEDLGLSSGKKTKTGYSTDEKVLSGLIDAHPIIAKILEYREIHKLKSTYIEPLYKLGLKEENARIHTSFLQTGTATGRLSSKNPNLQNIPVKTELGRGVRRGFVSKKGFSLIGIDYSQIELRLLAHFSEDPALVHAFAQDKDIHYETAVKIFGVADAKEKRGIAKSINFGLLYGMGARKLSQTIHVSQADAKRYIENYFASFPTVKQFLHHVAEEAKERGYAQTLLKRRRYFDFENANAMLHATYLREAVNTVFQGSAADLIKMAMNRIADVLQDDNSKLLLQIHDELIFEVRDEDVPEFSKKAQEIMEHIYKLKVPLKVSVKIGKNWGELK
ncbi:DNA polymerase I [Sulfurospirillum sp. 1612]|uniref:DNA polymerase I n=1 Tax=Sulfurospirillum sp. 1612 TaxID=3094835 RepID=UPI002F957AB6